MISPVGMTWYMVSPGELWHSILYGLAGMAWNMISLARYGMVCANAYVNSLPWALVPFTCGEANVSWRSCSQVQDPFTSKVTITCMFRSHVHLLFTLGSDSTLRDCEYISLFWDRIFEKLLLVILIKVDVESSKYQNNISCLSTTKIKLFRYVSVYNFRQ